MTILKRMILIAGGLLLCFTMGAVGTWVEFNNYTKWNENYSSSLELGLLLQKMQGSKSPLETDWSRFLPNLEEEHRQVNFSRFLEDLKNHSGQAKSSGLLVQENEAKYQEYARPKIEYYKKRVFLFGYFSFLSFFICLAYLFFEFSQSIRSPLQILTRRMTDFVANKYSYQFEVPSDNELGRLHSSFNEMAQTVLKNMKELQSLDHAKSEFLSIASHELRTPLTSIKGSLSLLKNGAKDLSTPSLKLLSIAQDETERLIRLINDLLDLAKIEAGEISLQKKWHSSRQLAEYTLKSLGGLGHAAGVNLTLNIERDFEIHADQDRIQQVLTNLLSNAIKYSPKGETVELRIALCHEGQFQQTLEFSVHDKGKGISPEDQELIFQKFRQATSSEHPLVKGTGLGLTIAQAIVEEHGGIIGVKSSPGRGSTFYFYLPDWREEKRDSSHNFREAI